LGQFLANPDFNQFRNDDRDGNASKSDAHVDVRNVKNDSKSRVNLNSSNESRGVCNNTNLKNVPSKSNSAAEDEANISKLSSQIKHNSNTIYESIVSSREELMKQKSTVDSLQDKTELATTQLSRLQAGDRVAFF